MSTLWTPSGEHQPQNTSQPTPQEAQGPPRGEQEPTEADIDALRQQIANADAGDVIANHCYGLFELAAIHLSQTPPALSDATLAIDALGGVLSACEGRLGMHEGELREALSQLRLAYVQVSVLKDEEQQL